LVVVVNLMILVVVVVGRDIMVEWTGVKWIEGEDRGARRLRLMDGV